ncbi:MAG: glutamine synthetase, type I [Promethearchaeota archaeon CR_4]|nr:MAG: glutamine synthetase, type I [Candidatus Lokiarchaeota archaeon CR_4]
MITKLRYDIMATKDDVLKLVEEKDVEFIRIWFTDVLGFLKSFAITPPELEGAFEEGLGFDGSSIRGFRDIHESDCVAWPDASTFQILPWRPKEKAVARMFADVTNPDGTPLEADPRYILKQMLKKASDKGYTFYVGPELEYFYFANDQCPEFLENAGYFDQSMKATDIDLRRETVLALEAMGMRIEKSHHEVAPSQHEIDMCYAEGLTMADNTITYKYTVKTIAQKSGVCATFMPKPVAGINGSGMHCHQSLFEGKKNAFWNPSDEYHLSYVGKSYIAGLLKYAPEFALVTNPWVNSYKRLVPGYEAPVYIAWARSNRSALVRVPMYKPNKEKATRCELRCPDPSCNPYLAFAVMLGAGLKGIEEHLELSPPVEKNIFHLCAEDKKKLNITEMPGSLLEAIQIAEKNTFLKEVLGEHVYNYYLESKKAEWDSFRTAVTDWEVKAYLPLL